MLADRIIVDGTRIEPHTGRQASASSLMDEQSTSRHVSGHGFVIQEHEGPVRGSTCSSGFRVVPPLGRGAHTERWFGQGVNRDAHPCELGSLPDVVEGQRYAR